METNIIWKFRNTTSAVYMVGGGRMKIAITIIIINLIT